MNRWFFLMCLSVSVAHASDKAPETTQTKKTVGVGDKCGPSQSCPEGLECNTNGQCVQPEQAKKPSKKTTQKTDESGCYSGPPSHSCDCDANQAACTQSGGIWTPQCQCGEDSPPKGDKPGCYSGPPKHACDCKSTEAACGTSGGLWTERCRCAPKEAAPAQGPGCYSGPPKHTCDCNTTEAKCTAAKGLWTKRCGCEETSK